MEQEIIMQKMQCYTIINVITSDKEAVYDVEDFALNVPILSTGWLQMGRTAVIIRSSQKMKLISSLRLGKIE